MITSCRPFSRGFSCWRGLSCLRGPSCRDSRFPNTRIWGHPTHPTYLLFANSLCHFSQVFVRRLELDPVLWLALSLSVWRFRLDPRLILGSLVLALWSSWPPGPPGPLALWFWLSSLLAFWPSGLLAHHACSSLRWEWGGALSSFSALGPLVVVHFRLPACGFWLSLSLDIFRMTSPHFPSLWLGWLYFALARMPLLCLAHFG